MTKKKSLSHKKKDLVSPLRQEIKPEVHSDLINSLFEKWSFTITFCLISLIGLFVFKDFLFLDKIFLYKDIGSDTLNIFYPSLVNTSRTIQESGVPSWSFNYGMGQNIFPFILKDPFEFILYFLSEKNLSLGIGIKEFTKVLVAGSLFYFYLKELKISPFTRIVGSILFSFSGFMIVGGGWYIFSFEVVVVALSLLAFERLLQHNKWYLFPLAIAFFAASNPFNLFIYGLFLLIYAFLRSFEIADKFDFRKFGLLLGKMIVLGLFGLAISSVFLVENIIQMIESPRVGGTNSFYSTLASKPIFESGNVLQNITTLFRLFSSDILGTGNEFKGAYNYLEAPLLYCGVITPLLLPQLFTVVSKRLKIAYAGVLLLILLPLIFPYFRYAFWLFSGDYYRGYAFIVVLVLLYFSLKALHFIDKQHKISIKTLLVTGIVLLSLLSINYFQHLKENPINELNLNVVRLLLVSYIVLLSLFSVGFVKKYLKIVLILFISIEAANFSYTSVNEREIVSAADLNQKVGYNDYSKEAISFIKKNDKGFYRIDKNYFSSPAQHASYNDGLVQNYFGTSSYHSFNQKYYIQFHQMLGLVDPTVESSSRWVRSVGDNQLFESITCVKYYLDNSGNTQNQILHLTYDSIAQFGNVKVLKNKYFLPLGICYDTYLPENSLKKVSMAQKGIVLLSAVVLNDNLIKSIPTMQKFNLRDTISPEKFNFDMFAEQVNVRKKDTLKITTFKQTNIKGKIDLQNDKLLYLQIPFDENWKAFDNGKEINIEIINNGMMGLILKKGKHSIELLYEHRYMKITTFISVFSAFVFCLLILFKRFRKNQYRSSQINL